MFNKTIESLLPQTQKLLCELLRFPSTPGQELDAMRFLETQFSELGVKVERVPLSDSIKKDPDYSDPVPDIKYDGRFNLRLRRKGTGKGPTLLFNAHVDVVPPSEGMENPWNPRVENGVVYARGACDDKGQVAVLYLLLKTLDTLKIQLNGDLVAHLVVEEENGGNGSLAMVRAGEKADGCVVLEPSECKLFAASRGAVWFRLTLTGKAGHSGAAAQSRSALLMARDAIAILEKYQKDLLAASRGIPLFDPFPNPMPITFGKLHAGNWPATAPSRAVIEGVLGLLPNKTKEQVCEGMREALRKGTDEFFMSNCDLHFMYRHDSSVCDPKHPFAQALLAAGKKAGQNIEVTALTASSDAWFYSNQLKVPTVTYGAGSLKVAHSKDEQIAMKEIATAAEVLANLAQDYCGAEGTKAQSR
jgi:acetylornithine deacetylase